MHDFQIRRDNITDPQRAQIASELARFYGDLAHADASLKPQHRFSMTRVFSALKSETGLRSGYEREVSAAFAVARGLHYDPNRPEIPFSLLAQRDLTAGTGSAGGYLAGTQTATAVDALRGASVVVDGGVDVLEGLIGNVSVPLVTASPTVSTPATEGTALTESQPTFGALSLVPKSYGTYIEFSRLLDLQVPSLDRVLTDVMRRKVGEVIDTAVISGILNTSGPTSQSGSSLSWANALTMKGACLTGGARDDELTWVGAPGVYQALAGRERFSGAGAIWNDFGIAGNRAIASKVSPSGSLVVGPWSSAKLGIWGGVVVEFNPYAAFTSGIKAARLLVSIDFGLTNAGAFAMSSNVS